MTRNGMIEALKNYCVAITKDLRLPISIQKGDTKQEFRAPEVYKMRLPNSKDAKKVAPYILIQFVSGVDKQPHGKQSESDSVIRFIFTVYDDNEQEGAMMLLNVMEKLRISLLKDVVIGKRYKLDTDAGLESFVYTDDTAPYYAGEMIGTFKMNPIEREVYHDGIIY